MTGKERRESSSSSGSGSSDSSSDDEDTKPSSDSVLNKYNMAAEIVNSVLKELLAEAKEGVSISKLCALGDSRIIELTGKLFKNQKDVKKGIAMPTCVSVNNCVCHFSPLASEPEILLKNGQMVKFDIGAHVDGYIATAAHTTVVGASKENKVKEKKAKVVLAAYNAMELVLRMLRPEKEFKNMDVTEYISQLCKIYDTTPIENMLSHEMQRFKITAEKQIIQNPTEEQKSKMEKCTFENYEVYGIDILVSTGEGKSKPMDTRTTVYKKNDDLIYQLKMKAARTFFSEAQTKFGVMPFSLRLFEDEVKAKMGVVECERHNLLTPYQVLYEREGEFVAQFKTTVIITPTGISKITGLPLEHELYSCNTKISDPKLAAILQGPLKTKKKNNAAPAATGEKKPTATDEKKPAATDEKKSAATDGKKTAATDGKKTAAGAAEKKAAGASEKKSAAAEAKKPATADDKKAKVGADAKKSEDKKKSPAKPTDAKPKAPADDKKAGAKPDTKKGKAAGDAAAKKTKTESKA